MAAFSLTGSHYDIGFAIGRGSSHFVLPNGWPEPPPLAFAQACARDIAAIHAPILDELYGHADAQAQPYEQLLRILCREKLGGRPAYVPEQGGCTSVAWRAPNGHLLVGRNYDFYPIQRVRQRIHLAPEGSRSTVGMRGSVPCGRYDGVNEAGLFVSLHVVLAIRPERSVPGVPFHLIPRLLLECCDSVPAAVDLLTQLPHIHSFNYLIADGTQCAVVECHAERLRILYPTCVSAGSSEQGDILAVGNFYRHPDIAPLQRHRRQTVSRQRIAYLESADWQHDLSARQPDDAPVSAELRLLQTALRDHSVPVCGHEGGHTTLWSCVADLTSRQILYSSARPCLTPYEAVAWPGLGSAIAALGWPSTVGRHVS